MKRSNRFPTAKLNRRSKIQTLEQFEAFLSGADLPPIKFSGGISDLTVCNPAPDGSPPQLPTGKCRNVTITRD